MKKCSRCKKEKSVSEFYVNRTAKDGLTSSCKDCEKAKTQRYLERRIKREALSIAVSKEGRPVHCQACGKKETVKSKFGQIIDLAKDHDHLTGKNRGYLCRRCNIVLGLSNDQISILAGLITYLYRRQLKIS